MGMFGKYECRHAAIKQMECRWQAQFPIDNKAYRRTSIPVSYIKGRIVQFGCTCTYKYGSMFCTFFMYQHEVNGLDRITGLPSFLNKSMKPSADSAHFRVIYGRCKVWKVMKRLMRYLHSFSNTPTITSRPASFSFCIPRSATLEKGSWQPMTIRGIRFSITNQRRAVFFHDENRAQG